MVTVVYELDQRIALVAATVDARLCATPASREAHCKFNIPAPPTGERRRGLRATMTVRVNVYVPFKVRTSWCAVEILKRKWPRILILNVVVEPLVYSIRVLPGAREGGRGVSWAMVPEKEVPSISIRPCFPSRLDHRQYVCRNFPTAAEAACIRAGSPYVSTTAHSALGPSTSKQPFGKKSGESMLCE